MTDINLDINIFQPLSDYERDELNEFLSSDQVTDGGMTLEGIDGYFCALAVNPEPVMPSQALSEILGTNFEYVRWFKSESQANHIVTLIMRHWHTVHKQLQNKPETEADDFYIPFIFEPDEDDDDAPSNYGMDWAKGFHRGIASSNALSLLSDKDDDVISALGIIMLLELGYNSNNPTQTLTLKDRKEMVIALSAIAYWLYAYWHNDNEAAVPSTRYSNVKIGRNELCPCGSGKKYKKCCGLH